LGNPEIGAAWLNIRIDDHFQRGESRLLTSPGKRLVILYSQE